MIRPRWRWRAPALAAALTILGAALSLAADAPPTEESAGSDSLVFIPIPEDSEPEEPLVLETSPGPNARSYYGDRLLQEPGTERAPGFHILDGLADYNRVDRVRLGLRFEARPREPLLPRLGARIEFAFQRDRALYGVRVEQPLIPSALALGVTMLRATDHFDLQQTDDAENSLTLAVGHMDYRDYFERESHGAYLAYTVPGATTASVRFRSDDFRSLPDEGSPWSLFHRKESIRKNPAIDDGEARVFTWRLERQAARAAGANAGFFHWIELERAGRGAGGDFSYVRLLADVRTTIRLSPATTLALRGVVGHHSSGVAPAQKRFVLGGVDGLRAHANAEYRGDQAMLAQMEYAVGLWRLRSEYFDGGLHAIVFLDTGAAWSNPDRTFDPRRQHFQTDAGFGIGTAEDNLRVYFAKNLRDPDSPLHATVRFQRPF